MSKRSAELKQAEKGAIVSIIAYVILAVLKLGIGSYANSKALYADGLNNFTDTIASVAILIGLRLSRKPADNEHRYGHWKAENVASLLTSLVMFVVGFEVLKNAVESLIHKNIQQPEPIAAFVGIFSAIVMYGVYLYNKKLGEKYNSSSLIAVSKDNFSDMLTSLGAAIAVFTAAFQLAWLDTVTALIIALIILKTAFDIFKESTFYLSDGFDKEKLVLKQANFQIQSGQTVGIIGGTGSGKTSLIQLIPRLYDVTSGQVKVGGQDVKDYSIEALRDSVSVVLQNNVLFSGTIKENLRWGNEQATDQELIEACQLAQADEFIQRFPNGYNTYIEQGGSNVSGGQKQRLTIARALLKKPKILILDDSTSAVDTKTDALIQQAFYQTIPDTTKIIIAQRITSVEQADLVIVMEEGKINGVGTPAEMLATNQIYQEVYQSQQKGFGAVHE